MTITLDTKLTKDGVLCSNDVLGKVATIHRHLNKDEPNCWEVFPYAFPPYEMRKSFRSYQAAEHYALALAYEMMENRELSIYGAANV